MLKLLAPNREGVPGPDMSRVANLNIPFECLVGLLSLDGSKKVTIKGLPKDARIITSHEDWAHEKLILKIWSSEFASVPEGCFLPEIKLEVSTEVKEPCPVCNPLASVSAISAMILDAYGVYGTNCCGSVGDALRNLQEEPSGELKLPPGKEAVLVTVPNELIRFEEGTIIGINFAHTTPSEALSDCKNEKEYMTVCTLLRAEGHNPANIPHKTPWRN